VARRLFGVVEEGGVQDPGGGYRALLGTLMLQVSDDACGVFALDLEPFPKTYISGTNLAPVSVSRSPLMITIAAGAEDCNANALPDSCDVIAGSSPDENGNELPDECDLDLDKDRDADLRDAAAMINCFGNATPACAGANFHPSPAINLADWAAMATSMNGPGPSSD
jgi:hypothetical protein